MKLPIAKKMEVEALEKVLASDGKTKRKVTFNTTTVEGSLFTGRISATSTEVVVEEGGCEK